MKNTDIDVLAVSRLAHLELTQKEMEHYEGELRALVEFTSCLSEYEKSEDDAIKERTVDALRADEPAENVATAEELLGLSKSIKDGYLSVPMTVSSDEV